MLAVAIAFAAPAAADDGSPVIEEVVVTARAGLLGFGKTRANTTVDAGMASTHAPGTDVLRVVDRLPGVNVQFGDAVGGNNWSTRVSVRGMANTRDTSQIGYMIDRMPGGDAAYGGGQKPNVFVDAENVAVVEVAQNAVDIGSASNTALGGTLHYHTREPRPDFGLNLAYGEGGHGRMRMRSADGAGGFRRTASPPWTAASRVSGAPASSSPARSSGHPRAPWSRRPAPTSRTWPVWRPFTRTPWSTMRSGPASAARTPSGSLPAGVRDTGPAARD